MTSTNNSNALVVCVDDEPAILNALHRSLGSEPYRLMMTTDPREALGWVEHMAVALIICDERMPGMNGTELVKAIHDRSPQTRRLILTGYADLDAARRAINEGRIHRLLDKPWDEDQLRGTVRLLLYEREFALSDRETELDTARQNRELDRWNGDLHALLRRQTRSLRLAQEILDQVPLAVAAVVAGDSGISYCNDAFLRFVSGRRSALRGRPLEAVFPAAVCEKIHVLFDRSGSDAVFDVKFCGRDVSFRLLTLQNSGEVLAVMVRVEP